MSHKYNKYGNIGYIFIYFFIIIPKYKINKTNFKHKPFFLVRVGFREGLGFSISISISISMSISIKNINTYTNTNTNTKTIAITNTKP